MFTDDVLKLPIQLPDVDRRIDHAPSRTRITQICAHQLMLAKQPEITQIGGYLCAACRARRHRP
jgi:hypothetical protein